MEKQDAMNVPTNLYRAIKAEARRRNETIQATMMRVLFDHFDEDIKATERGNFLLETDDVEQEAG